MAKFEGIVYDPPVEGAPYLAALFINGEFKVAYAASSEEDGEHKIAIALRELANMAERDTRRI